LAVLKEEHLQISGPSGAIEVAFTLPVDGDFCDHSMCAVVCHPHPLHGGTMDNKVVVTLVRTYKELGIPVARFNFRGVGRSEGAHDNGNGEADDLKAVIDWLAGQTGAKKVLLAGFSFGTGVVNNICGKVDSVCHAVFVAPPVGRYNFDPVEGYPCPTCVVMGDQDELVDAEDVYSWADSLVPQPAVIKIPEATHFFHGQLVRLRSELMDVLKRQLVSR